ncbi:MAG: hypothetical protein WBD20_01130 [Pirellulaceae bacterium]
MSVDLSNDDSAVSPEAKDQWKALRKKIRVRAEKQSVKTVFGHAAKKGSVYRWGIEAATQAPLEPIDVTLSRLACNKKVDAQTIKGIDWQSELESTIGQIMMPSISATQDAALNAVQCARAVMWAAATPELIDHLDYRTWWDLVSELQSLRDTILEKGGAASLPRLIIGGEMGLTLAWRLADLPSCGRLQKSAISSVLRWCEHEEDSIAATIAGATSARLGLASLIRCRSIIESTTGTRFKRQQKNILADLATWVAAFTTHHGGTAFGNSELTLADDTRKHGLLDAAVTCDPESLKPAMNAARGKTQTGGRLVWEISLPEAVHHCDQSSMVVMLCEWDVAAGRMHLDYSGDNIQIELFGKKKRLVAGDWETSIEIAGQEQRPAGPWVSSCEYTDDDVHYLELEQSWTGGVVLQRQLMTIRDDRIVMWADCVLPRDDKPGNGDPLKTIRYASRFPLAAGTQTTPEAETRELYLGQKSNQALAIPLSASEWRTGQTDTTLRVTDDDHLLLSSKGNDRLFVPLWFDFTRRRFKRKRTWRQLTIADDLRIVRHNEAAGFRIQLGSEQWLLYRSLHGSRTRSVLGKHLIADFYAGRFYMNDGSVEAIVSVDDTDNE